MKRQEFITALREKLLNLPRKDTDERIGFYEEMIDDKIEEGMSEEEAIASVGTIDSIYAQMLEEIPFIEIIREKIKQKKRANGGKIALIISASPIWLSLSAVAFAIYVSLIAAIWSIVVSFWAVFVSFAASTPIGVIVGLFNAFSGNVLFGFALIFSGIILAGLTILAFYGCRYTTKWSAVLTKKTFLGIKKIFVR